MITGIIKILIKTKVTTFLFCLTIEVNYENNSIAYFSSKIFTVLCNLIDF